MTQWINLKLEQQICVSALIFCIVRKNWPYSSTASGSYGRQAGRQADWQTKYWWTLNFFKFSTDEAIHAFICLLSLQCYYSIRTTFHMAL